MFFPKPAFFNAIQYISLIFAEAKKVFHPIPKQSQFTTTSFIKVLIVSFSRSHFAPASVDYFFRGPSNIPFSLPFHYPVMRLARKLPIAYRRIQAWSTFSFSQFPFSRTERSSYL